LQFAGIASLDDVGFEHNVGRIASLARDDVAAAPTTCGDCVASLAMGVKTG
jgi:hypothetical protein